MASAPAFVIRLRARLFLLSTCNPHKVLAIESAECCCASDHLRGSAPRQPQCRFRLNCTKVSMGSSIVNQQIRALSYTYSSFVKLGGVASTSPKAFAPVSVISHLT